MESNEIKVSIIVPVYKVEAYLDGTVESVRGQTYQNLEIILIDDGSSDRCGEMCDEFAGKDNRIKVIHKSNGGLSSARNAGLDLCTGDYIVCIDSDDIVARDYIEYLLMLALKSNADAVACGCAEFMDGSIMTYDLNQEKGIELNSYEALKDYLYMRRIWTNVAGKCFKRKLYTNIRYPEGKYYEDLPTIYRLFANSNMIVYGRSIKFGYRIRKTAQSRQPFSPKEMDCIEMASIVYEDVKLQFPQLEKAAACRYLSAASHIFFMTPKKGAEIYQKECWDIICKLRGTVLFDGEARPEARAMALLSFEGQAFTYKIGQLLGIGK